MMLVTLLVSPYLLYYDLTLLLIPMVLASCSPLATGAPWGRRHIWPGLTAVLYLTAEMSRSIAGVTRIQIIVPVMMIYLLVLADCLTALNDEQSKVASEEP
jgi:hypothetical protein